MNTSQISVHGRHAGVVVSVTDLRLVSQELPPPHIQR